jgi:hypothetical protein
MTDADLIYNSTVRQTWDALHGAFQNQFYHQMMAEQWSSSILMYRIAAVVLVILGIAPILVTFRRQTKKDRLPARWNFPAPKNKFLRLIIVLILRAFHWLSMPFRRARIQWRNVVALALAIIGGILFVRTTDGMYVEHHLLNVQWIGITDELQQIRNKVLDLPDNAPVTPEMRAQVTTLQRRSKDLLKCETDALNEVVQKKAWEDANEHLYGIGVRTKQQVVDAFAAQKSKGRIPVRPKPKQG